MIRCIAVDDEKLALDLLADNIRQVPYLQLMAQCKNALQAIELLQNKPVDLIFLDVQMPGLSGLQFLNSLENPPMAIIHTAYEQYALKGFELNVVDYLVKPVSFERFLKACNRARALDAMQKETAANEIEPVDYLFFHVEYNLVKVVLSEIRYVEGLKDYVKIYVDSSDKPVITRHNLKAMEQKLPSQHFARIHKSYIIRLDKVTGIKRDVVCLGEKEVPYSMDKKHIIEKITRFKPG